MGLVTEQDIFLQHVAKLIAHAKDLGFVITGGELFRTPEQQRIHMREGRSKTMSSRHMKRLAIDLNFFTEGPGGALSLCYDKSVLQPLGDFWEGLDALNRWGGNWQSFKDTPHFERQGDTRPAAASPTHAPGEGPAGGGAGEDRRGLKLLAGSVGRQETNNRNDVELIQRLLNNAADKSRFEIAAPLVPDGLFGGKTAEAIAAYQAQALGVADPDGAADPDGRTVRALCAEVESGFSPLMLSLIMLAASEEDVAAFAGPMADCLEQFSLNTPLRQAHFLAQIGHESGELRFKEELASGEAYEHRRDLGNVEPGDGVKYKGRGLIQLTGRANYRSFGSHIGREDEIMDNPEIVASDMGLCVAVAGWFWNSRELSRHADNDDLMTVTKRINGGTNGIDHRRALLNRAKSLYGLN